MLTKAKFFKKKISFSLLLVVFLIAFLTTVVSILEAWTLAETLALQSARSWQVQDPEVRWYVIRLGSQKIGFLKETGEKIQENGQWKYVGKSDSKMVFNRLGKKVELIFKTEQVESENGHLLRVSSEQVLSSQAMRVEAVIEERKIVIKSTAGNRTFARQLPYDGELLGPEGISQLTNTKLKRPGDKVEFKTFLAELGQVASGERILVGEEEIELNSQKLKTRKIEEKFDGLGVTRKLWIDEQGNEVKSVEPSPFGELVTELSSQQEAVEGMTGLNLDQDQYRLSLVKANIRLPQARQLDRLLIKIVHKNPEIGWPDLENEYQKILHQDSASLVLEIKRVEVKRGINDINDQEKLSDTELWSYLKGNAYLAPDDPEIKKVAQEVAGREKDNFNKALKLRDWVSRNMTFDLGIVFAPASEIIKTRRGTCAGYAALLASLLRSAGIPSRYVIGLVYAQGIWGGHAWVEAYIDGQWVPLDAAVPGPGVADPARLAVARSSLEEGLGEILASAQKIFGQVEIEIQEYGFNNRNFKVKPGMPLSEVKNNVYYNPGLGLSFKAPAGFTFADLDKVWPDKTLFTLNGPAGQQIKLLQEGWLPVDNLENYLVSQLQKEIKNCQLKRVKVWGKERPFLVTAEKSAVIIVNGVDVFLLTASGQNSEGLLRAVLPNFLTTLRVD